MTPTMLTAVPPTVHRRRNPARPSSAHRRMAERIRAALAAQQIVVVEVTGSGRGWYVTAVRDGVYEMHRDRASMTVPWNDVPLGQQ